MPVYIMHRSAGRNPILWTSLRWFAVLVAAGLLSCGLFALVQAGQVTAEQARTPGFVSQEHGPAAPLVTDTPTSTPTCVSTSDYVFTQQTGATIVAGTTDVGSHCDECIITITLPFTYNLYGSPKTTAWVSSNGVLKFDNGSVSATNSCLPNIFILNSIMAYWDDLRTDGTGTGVFTSVSGTTPNRIFNIEWRACINSGAACTSATMHFEVRLYEGQNTFDIIYGALAQTGTSASVGVEGGSIVRYTQFECGTGGLSNGLRLLAVLTPTCITPTATPTITLTRTPSNTLTPSNTPTLTNTPTSTPTATPVPGCWSIYDSPNPPFDSYRLSDIGAVSATDVWAVGSIISSNVVTGQALIEHWNGSYWTLVTVLVPNADEVTLEQIAVVSASDVWAVGYYRVAGASSYRTLAMHWNGTLWAQVQTPNPDNTTNYLHGIDARAFNDIWAVGSYPFEFENTPLVLHYDGSTWQQMTGLPAITDLGTLTGIDAITASDVWVVGYTDPPFDPSEPVTLHYNGSTWSSVPVPSEVAAGTLARVAAVSSFDVWAVGADTTVQPQKALTLRWTGAQWNVVPNPGSDSVLRYNLFGLTASATGEVWAVGDEVGTGYAQPFVIHWAGGGWARVGPGNLQGLASHFYGVDRFSAGDVWAVGTDGISGVSGSLQTLVERFTNPCNPPLTSTPTTTVTATPVPGCSTVVSSPNSGLAYNYLNDIAVLSASNIWAVGKVDSSQSGNTEQALIEHWDGAKWNIMAARVPGVSLVTLTGITAVSASNIWAVGYTVDAIPSTNIHTLLLHWDGIAWTTVAVSDVGTSNYLSGVDARASNDIWAVGHYFSSGNGPFPLVLHYDGSTWQRVTTLPTISAFDTIEGVDAISATDVWVVGNTRGSRDQPLTLHYNGTAWSMIDVTAGADRGALTKVAAISSTDIWAVGTDRTVQPWRALTMHWNGVRWSAVPNPGSDPTSDYELYDLATLPSGEVWTVGRKTASGQLSTFAMHWGGGGWALVTSPDGQGTDSELHGVARVSASDVWAVGYSSSTGNSQTLIERFANPCNPATPTPTITPTPRPGCWSIYANPDGPPQVDYNSLYDVGVVSSSDVWAVGDPHDPYTGQALIEHWNGSLWSIVPLSLAGSTYVSLDAVSVASANDIWAVGSYRNTSSVYLALALHWNGSSWLQTSGVTPGTSSFLNGVDARATNDVWAVGYYYQSSTKYPLILHYTGSSWQVAPNLPALPDFDDLTSVKAISATDVWAVGSTRPSDQLEPLTMHYDGNAWSIVSVPSAGGNIGSLSEVAAVSSTDVWAIGTDLSVEPRRALTLRWTGTRWNVVAIPDTGFSYTVKDLTTISSGEVWAVGEMSDNGEFETFAMHWGGSIWDIIGTPSIQGQDDTLFGVDAVSANDVWAVGDSYVSAAAQTLLERFTNFCNPPTSTPTYTPSRTRTNTPTRTVTPTVTNTPTNTSTPTFTCVPGSDYTIQLGGASQVAGTVDIGNHCDDCTTAITLPFPFQLYSTTFTSANVSSNGNLQFASANTASGNTCLPNASFLYTILGFWDDLRTDGTGAGVFTSVSGTAPNRTFNIEWRGCIDTGAPCTTAASNFEIRLYEGQVKFAIHYTTLENTGTTATVGVTGSNVSRFTQYTCDTGNLFNNLVLTFTIPPCQPTPTATPTNTRTSTPTFTPTPTDTPTRTSTPVLTLLVGHVTWQGPPAQPSVRQQLPVTLTLCVSGTPAVYGATTDSSGFFTVTSSLPTGSYNWSAKGSKYLAISGTTLLTAGATTQVEMGVQRAGDVDNTHNNVVNITDFNVLKGVFGTASTTGDLDNNGVTNVTDFNLLKGNFGQAGVGISCP